MRMFAAPVLEALSVTLPALVGAANASIGKNSADHQAESVVQHLMRSALVPHLPSPDLVRENEKLGPSELSTMIPDLIIDRIAGGYWGIFEVKTLLRDDQLSVSDVNRDLEKLCAYKKHFPESAAIFALIGSKAKLSNGARTNAWASSKLRYEKSVFLSSNPARQEINADFSAIPSASSSPDSEVQTYLWEIQANSAHPISLSTCYKFNAEMHAPAFRRMPR